MVVETVPTRFGSPDTGNSSAAACTCFRSQPRRPLPHTRTSTPALPPQAVHDELPVLPPAAAISSTAAPTRSPPERGAGASPPHATRATVSAPTNHSLPREKFWFMRRAVARLGWRERQRVADLTV